MGRKFLRLIQEVLVGIMNSLAAEKMKFASGWMYFGFLVLLFHKCDCSEMKKIFIILVTILIVNMLSAQSAYSLYHSCLANANRMENEAAMKDIEAAILLKPDFAKAYHVKGNLNRDRENYSESILDYDKAISLDPSFVEAYYDRGTSKYCQGNYSEAILYFDKVILLDSSFERVYIGRGNSKGFLGEYQEAILDLDKAISREPNFARAYAYRGHMKNQIGKYEEATLDFDIAISLDTTDARTFLKRGLSREHLGLHEEAILDYDIAIALEPNYAVSYYRRGFSNGSLERHSAAILDFDMAISLDPTNALAYESRGESKRSLGEDFDAIQDFDKAISLNPMDVAFYDNRGFTRAKIGEYMDAILDYDRAIVIDTNNSHLYIARGLAKFALGKYSEAILDYDRAISLEPQSAYGYFNRGILREQIGQIDQAILDFRLVVRIEPNNQNAKQILNKLEEKIRSIPSKVWAVAVGVSQYKATHIFSSLNTTDDHAQEFARLLEGYDITDQAEIPVLTDIGASRSQILGMLKSVFLDTTKIGVNDVVIFFFAGHGESVNGKAGLCPFDYADSRDLITESEIWSILEQSPARHKVCFIDACKTEHQIMARGLSLEEREALNRSREDIKEGIVYFTSTKVGEPSIELGNRHGAIFSYHLLKGLKGLADANSDRTVTIEELYQYVSEEVKRESNGTQIPQINSGGFDWNLPLLVLPIR